LFASWQITSARVWAPDYGSDSLYAQVDEEGQITWETQQNDGWIWDRVRGLAGEGTTSGPSPARGKYSPNQSLAGALRRELIWEELASSGIAWL